MSRGTIRRTAIALMVGGGLLVTYPAVSGGLLWDLGAACGYMCLVLVVCLYIFPVRADGLPHARLFALSQHRTLGWCVLCAAMGHAAVVLLAEPLSARYLLPSAPIFMWCGIAALLVLVALVMTGLSARAQLRNATAVAPSSTRSKPTGAKPAPRATLHVVLAAMLMLTASAHIVGSSQLLSGVFKPVVVLLLLALPLGWYALRPRPAQRGSRGPAASGSGVGAPDGAGLGVGAGVGAVTVGVGGQGTGGAAAGDYFGSAGVGIRGGRAAAGTEHSGVGSRALVRPASHLAAVAVIALMPAPVSKQLLLEPAVRPSVIPVSFPHDSHTSVSCVTCHHNYVDHTGTTACVECHRSARADLVHSSESTFHTFCRDCHTQLALDSEKHGPTRSCSACHQGIRSNNL